MVLRNLPKIDRLLDAPDLRTSRAVVGTRVLKSIARDVVEAWRDRVRDGAEPPTFDRAVADVRERVEAALRARPRRVVNATGVVLHTNLGRAPLPAEAARRIGEMAGGYVSLEYDVEAGRRSRRGADVERALADWVGAEAALVVNNNAAAVLLALATLGAGGEVVVSRGELVEIGGGFRIPEVLARSGAALVEVGTTNRTRPADYVGALGESTRCLLRVHPSNFKMTGFTERPARAELARVAREHGVPLVEDLGGGVVVDLPPGAPAALGREPTVQSCLREGADLVCFSLDKLFGGPQGGAVVGRAALVDRLRRDPLARALRVDKLTLLALEPVLDAYSRGDLEAIPAYALLLASLDDLEARVSDWREELGADLAACTSMVRTEAPVGGGTLAEEPVESVALALDVGSPDAVATALRRAPTPVIGRIEDGRVLLDARTVLPGEDPLVVAAVRRALGDGRAGEDPISG